MFRIMLIYTILQGALMAIEEPNYIVVQTNDTYEIRKYNSYLVAQTKVSGSFDEMGKKAFNILFKYISGENKKREKIKMTAPVIQENAKRKGQKISMTAPVIQEMDKTNTKSATYSFVMPEKFTMETLPLPLNESIKLVKIPQKILAVREYSGNWSEEKYEKNEQILLNALKSAGIEIIGNPTFARYNSPFSLWFLRRNEIMVEVKQ
ncbi:MAG: Heme-binding protein [uncultured Sulfurovum sp.]|uniref:Heme-binding protein n=1 Tax=uncultured Sulfurovum sp. TaxID=269237 RepID=A0A6S6U3K3_9BACT|nr:MAG: Heme-binding protein [uncultured Sulfurovum sp.]